MRSSLCSHCGQTVTFPSEVEGEGVAANSDRVRGRRLIWTAGGTLLHACIKVVDSTTGQASYQQMWPGTRDSLAKLGPLPPFISPP